MRVLAIDPGYDRVGIAVVEYQAGKEFVCYSTCIETDRNTPFHDRLVHIGESITTIINAHHPTCVAIETLFFNKNVKTAIGVAQARGMILYIAKTNDCAVYEFGPQEIKIAVTGYGNSDKTAVTHLIKQTVLAVPENALDDEYDAIAVGVTCLAHYGRGR